MTMSRRNAISAIAAAVLGAAGLRRATREEPTPELSPMEKIICRMEPYETEAKGKAAWARFCEETRGWQRALDAAPSREERDRLYLERYKASVLFGAITPQLRIPDWDRTLGIELAHGRRAIPLPA